MSSGSGWRWGGSRPGEASRGRVGRIALPVLFALLAGPWTAGANEVGAGNPSDGHPRQIRETGPGTPPAAVWAQDTALGKEAFGDSTQARLSELETLMQALQPRVEAARREARRADSLRTDSLKRARQIPLDTVQVGPLRIVTVPEQTELAREVFSEIWEVYQPLVMGSEDLLHGHLFLFRYGWRFGETYLEGDHVHNVEMSRRFGMDRLRAKVRNALGHALVQSLPPDASSLRDWVGMTPLTPPLDWSWIYRELASTPALAARRCYQGDVGWCLEALGISMGNGGWEEWYTPEERRLLVERRFESRTRLAGFDVPGLTREALLVHGCLELRVDRACLEILEAWPGKIPLSVSARASLVAEALRQGGEGAFSRLIGSPDTALVARLTWAASLPADTLAVRWRDTVLSSRPRVHAGLLLSPLPLILWVLLLLFFASRSTPWRLG